MMGTKFGRQYTFLEKCTSLWHSDGGDLGLWKVTRGKNGCFIGGVHLVIAQSTDLWTVEYYTARRDDEEDENIHRLG